MNWIGGARNRLRFNGDRNIQKEFFDRKRLGPKLSSDRNLLKKKRQVSQDLLALQTVNRAHSTENNGSTGNRSFKSVDLDKFQSCTRQINEVDMGPCSPGKASSSLLLADRQRENRLSNQQSVKFNENQSTNILSKTMKDLPGNWMKNKYTLAADRDSGYSFSDPSFHKEETLPKKNPDDLEKRSKHYTMKMNMSAERACSNFSIKPTKSHQKFDSPIQTVYNPFVSEDFQVTPVTKYDLHKKEHKYHRHHHKSKTNKSYCDRESPNAARYSRNVPFQFSSTPMKRTLDQTRDMMHQNSDIQLSPIKKLSSHYKDEFQYKPRSMVTPKQSMEHTDNKPHALDVFHTASVMNLYAHDNDQPERKFHSDIDSQQSKTPLEKPAKQDMQTPGIEYGPSDFYKKLCTAGNKDNRTDSFCDKDSLKLFKSDQTPCSALSMYKNALSENEDISPADLQREKKPTFIDIEDDFVYKPNLSFGKMRTTADKIQSAGQGINTKCHQEEPHDQYQSQNTMGSRSRKIPHTSTNHADDDDNQQTPSVQIKEQLLNISAEKSKDCMWENNLVHPGSDDSLILSGGRKDFNSPLQYVPIKDQIEDVLKEMSDLEKQDKQDSQTSLDVAIQAMENDIPNSAGDEADKFLESENLDLEILEHNPDNAKAATKASPEFSCVEKIDFSQESLLTREADCHTKITNEQPKVSVELSKQAKVDKCSSKSSSDVDNHDDDRSKHQDYNAELLYLCGDTLNETECNIVVQVADVSSGKNQTTQTQPLIDVKTVQTQTCEQHTFIQKGTQTDDPQTNAHFTTHIDRCTTETQTEIQNSYLDKAVYTVNDHTQTDLHTPYSLSKSITQSSYSQTDTPKYLDMQMLHTQTGILKKTQIETQTTQTQTTDIQTINTRSISVGVNHDLDDPNDHVPNLIQLACRKISKLTKNSLF